MSDSSTANRGSAEGLDVFSTLEAGFELSLRSANKSRQTVRSYMGALRFFREFLQDRGMPLNPAHIKREHVEAWIDSLLHSPAPRTGKDRKPATPANRYRSLRVWFNWLVDEGEIRVSPMAKMKPPRVPVEPPDVLSMEDFRKLLRVCSGASFYERRDTAILLLLYDTGIRREELAGLRLEDIDWQHRAVHVIGKGRKHRAVPLSDPVALALNRYVRARALYKNADKYPDVLWLGTMGPLTADGIRQALERLGRKAGVANVHAHRFRHTFSHEFLLAGGQESDLMELTGWESREMLRRYGRSAASERAREAHDRFSPAARLTRRDRDGRDKG